ncbi:5-carboxymethyl-2-hydroxymuconate isomerase [Sphingomonas histidinilytica]|uniref:2-keto-4-pentenoate hydratase/2-oxohepta-3-ene-1,7-dioic acid hydratase (Catechol pathway) n=1 Tax=Rhizorhabdus histidinilytica TaxID=439228 RepID=A0A1T5FBA4_9SPHN|nr:fumarylacetoacetate hydrolase family protein [Rhizorhabdus histidinilytica]MBO9375810.1 5-carboxymethyl-2-hydroxymuconate isomerase [Rhizorhabdus histidinilytica]SKB93358.1 2-keto-4-pentenoate hydratase/2-oxohepta-3-ene-1,7-dioic acid hydratase (catechol pathway) [Rhizorhabdus histidinilytica]
MNTPSFALGSFVGDGDTPFPALVIGELVHPLAGLAGFEGIRSMLDLFDDWDRLWPLLREQAERRAADPGPRALTAGMLQAVAPIVPRQIICSGANYRKHVIDIMIDQDHGLNVGRSREERRIEAVRVMDHRAAKGQPFAFLKPFSSILGPFDDLAVPADSEQLDWELELGVVIGKPARRVGRDRALDHVAGYVVVNDISVRDHLYRPDVPQLGLDWVSGKSGPGMLPMGPLIVPAAFVADPQDLMITLKLNGEVMQHESTADMIFPIARLIEAFSVHMQLLPGDIICTGSPSGNGTHFGRFLRPGDVMEGTIEGLGTQRNRCVAERLAEGAVLHRPFVPLEPA